MVSLPLFHICWALPTDGERKACDNFFADVFGAQTGFEIMISPDTADAGLDREESLTVVGNTMLIPIARPLGAGLTIRFERRRHAARPSERPGMWIGICVKVADITAADKWVSSLGFHPWYRPGFEEIYFVLPRDETLGMRIGIPGKSRCLMIRGRVRRWRADWWASGHPLGIEGLQSVGLSVARLRDACDLFDAKFGWREIARRTLPGDDANCAAFFVGDVVLEAMEPRRADTPLAHAMFAT